MAISPTMGSGTGLVGTSTIDRSSLGKDDFMMLLVTQLKNQDPLSPLQPHEFASQLAQFTSVEQLAQLTEEMAAQTEASHLSALIGKTSFSAALLGRGVVAEGDQVTVPASGDAAVTVDIGGVGGRATLRLLDERGREIATHNAGVIRGGRQTIELPEGIAPGTYRYEVTVEGPGDTLLPVTQYVTGVVDGVFFKNGRIMLRIGAIEVDVDSVSEVENTRLPEPVAGAPGTISRPPVEPVIPDPGGPRGPVVIPSYPSEPVVTGRR